MEVKLLDQNWLAAKYGQITFALGIKLVNFFKDHYREVLNHPSFDDWALGYETNKLKIVKEVKENFQWGLLECKFVCDAIFDGGVLTGME